MLTLSYISFDLASPDTDCRGSLVCFEHAPFAKIPGCEGGESDASKTDYCVLPESLEDGPSQPAPTKSPTTGRPTIDTAREESSIAITFHGVNPPPSKRPLGLCQGDCDRDADCESGLRCFQRSGGHQRVPGCSNGELDPSKSDYCIAAGLMSSPIPDPSPTKSPITQKPTSSPQNVPTVNPEEQPVERQSKPLKSFGGSPARWRFPLQQCEGKKNMLHGGYV